MKRTLSLAREALSALTADELASVAGAAAHTFPSPDCILSNPAICRTP